MRAVQYSFSEATASLWRGRRSAILAVGAIAVALFVLGGFLIVLANLDRLSAEWSRSAGMSVYLTDGVSEPERAAIETALAPGAVVEGREFVTKAAALSRFKEMFADLGPGIDNLNENPLPASYEVRLRTMVATDGQLDALGNSLRQMPGVADVRYDQQWLNRLATITRVIRGAGLFVTLILTLAAALTVAAVVRLALFARRDEIEIMQLVGAPTPYVRGPFVMEGVLQGGLGAVAALAGLTIVFFAIQNRVLTPLASALNFGSFRFLPAELSVLLVIGGMAIGSIGGFVAVWNR